MTTEAHVPTLPPLSGHRDAAMRDRLLAAVANSLQALLGNHEGGFDAAVRETLGALGTACGIHRVKVILERPAPESGELTHYLDHEWWAPGMLSQASLGLTQFTSAAMTPWTEFLHAGRSIWYLIEDVPIEVRAAFERVGVHSVGAVPIFGGGRYLGCVAFDDCAERRVWSDAEIDALSSAAGTIGGAIHRQELLNETFQVNRLLEGVVDASRVLLEDDDFQTAIPRWLCHLGVAIDADRTLFGGFTVHSNGKAVAEQHFEWMRAGMSSLKSLIVPSSSDFDVWAERLNDGETIWAHREDLIDPISARFWAEADVATNFIVPVVLNHETVAWLSGDFRTRREWSSAIVSVLRTAADGAAAAFKRRASVQMMLAERDKGIESERRRADEAARHARRLERHARVLTAMAQSAQDLLAADDPQDCVVAVLARVGEATGALRGAVTRFDWAPDDSELLGWREVTHEWTRPGAVRQLDTPLRRFAMRRDDASYDSMQRQFDETGRIVVKVEEQAEPYRSEQLGLGVVWVLGVPFVLEGKVAGSFGFDFDQPFEDFHAPDLAAIETLASSYANALLRASYQQRALAAERERADENQRLVAMLELVVRSSRALVDADDFEPALRVWLGELGRAAGASRASFGNLVVHEPSGLSTLRILCGWVSEGVEGSMAMMFAEPYAIDPRAAWEAVRLETGAAHVLHIGDTSPRMRDLRTQQGNQTVITVPIFLNGKQWGCLAFDHADKTEFDSRDAAVLQTAADMLAAILKRNEAADHAIAEQEARIAVEQRRFSELAHANDALRVSLDALADADGEHGFFKQSLLQIRAQSGATAAYLFSSERAEATLRLIGSVVDNDFSPVGRPDDPAMFRSGFTMVAELLAQLKARGRLLWRRVDENTVIDDDTPESTRWHLRLGHKANALHALIVGGRQVGLIGLVFDSETPPTEAQQELVHTLCQPLTLAFELARLSGQARVSAEQAAVRAERDRMAAEIHDSLAQSFTSIAMQSESLAGRLAGDPQSARVLRLIERTARGGLAEARASVLALHPLDAAPGALDQALAQLVERSSVEGGIECRFESEGTPCELSGTVRESLLRIAQEATSNAMRHSGGRTIRIALQYLHRRVMLTVEDDGSGLQQGRVPKQNGGFGMSGMESRAAALGGTVSFASSSMGGMLVAVDVPCDTAEGTAS